MRQGGFGEAAKRFQQADPCCENVRLGIARCLCVSCCSRECYLPLRLGSSKYGRVCTDSRESQVRSSGHEYRWQSKEL